jgi:phosphatidylglycerol:prolipoprotein diacylglycerol transferase
MTPAYLSIMAVAVTTGAYLSRRSQSDLPLGRTERWGIALGAFCGAMIGAKLPFVLTDLEGLRSGGAWLENGKTIMTGLAGGYLGVELAKWILEIRTKTGDSFAVPVAVSIGIGRIACFVAGCCHGVPTEWPWGVVFPQFGHMARHPTQLYETAFHLTAAIVLWQIGRRDLLSGQRVKLYIIAYLFYRFATETIRPEPRMLWDLTIYQWTAIVLLPVFVLLWVRDAQANSRPVA